MTIDPLSPSQEPEYVWEVATLFPPQGDWSEEEYLDLTDHSNRRIEFNEGRLEFLPMPTLVHERLVRFLFLALYGFVEPRKLGDVFWNGIRVRIRPGKDRLPDVLFLHQDHLHLQHNRVWDGADLVMEVVSGDPKDRARDYDDKLADYAESEIAVYWIVDPERVVIVHQLQDGKYFPHGQYTDGDEAISPLLPGFAIDVGALFSEIDNVPE
jgi:Uma2 family endonuclease